LRENLTLTRLAGFLGFYGFGDAWHWYCSMALNI
jgi:hypothetical protein